MNPPEELVSRSIRVSVMGFSDYVHRVDAFHSWDRFGFKHPNYSNAVDINDNPGWYNSMRIFHDFSEMVDWTDPQQASLGLRSLNWFLRNAVFGDDDERAFHKLFEEVETACREDGFQFRQYPREISQENLVSLDELNLNGFFDADGVRRILKKLNRAITKDKDNLETIGYSKSLMEAVAGYILRELGSSEDAIRALQYSDRCHLVMTELGIIAKNSPENSGTAKVAEGLNMIRRANNKLIEGIGAMRREDTDEGHGMPSVKEVSDANAQFALRSSVAWCHLVLDTYHEKTQQALPF